MSHSWAFCCFNVHMNLFHTHAELFKVFILNLFLYWFIPCETESVFVVWDTVLSVLAPEEQVPPPSAWYSIYLNNTSH